MRLSVVFLLIKFNCTDKSTTKPITIPKQIAKPVFVCDYSTNKLRCKKLYNSFKISPGKNGQQQLVYYLRDSIFPCWYGTKWDFYGNTEQPGDGTIACGYFVTTILRDVGVSFQRIKFAQLASEEIIKKTCIYTTIHRYSNLSLQEFAKNAKSFGFGLYIVGLDFHTGFILNDSTDCYFIHSNYTGPKCVMKEKANESSVLANSRYRVIGKVF